MKIRAQRHDFVAKGVHARAMDRLDHERSARRDPTVWLMLLVGLAFLAAGFTVAPQDNCNSAGECAPWLVPVAKWMGVFVTLMGAGQLAANPRRGCRIDPATGDLIWWKNRSARHAGQEGRIDPARIGRLAIRHDSDSPAAIRLYDQQGRRLRSFGAEVLPTPTEAWARALVARYPHIRLEISG